MIPQIIMLVLAGLTLGSEATKHGEYKTGKHNFWTTGRDLESN